MVVTKSVRNGGAFAKGTRVGGGSSPPSRDGDVLVRADVT